MGGDGGPAARELSNLLSLAGAGPGLFVTQAVKRSSYPMYGGQLLAQGLKAAGMTAPSDRPPASLHAYFLEPGDEAAVVEYQVTALRDGRSFTHRTVDAFQGSRQLLAMTVAFQVPAGGHDVQLAVAPVQIGDAGASFVIPRLLSFEGRAAEQEHRHEELRMRYWAHCTEDLHDPLDRACAIAYLSDNSNGSAPLNTSSHAARSSIDHTLWFHRDADPRGWLLLDLVPREAADHRSWYTGSIFDGSGRLVVSLAQEVLFRTDVRPYYPDGP